MPNRELAHRATPRPRRGSPDQTRQRLVSAAAAEFNRVGFAGTDSNRLARAAGYAPGTFYKHFTDKREIFLAAYAEWVNAEWAEIRDHLARADSVGESATAIVDATIDLHRRWRGLRASLRSLVAEDASARAFYRAQRRRQLAWLAELGRDAAAEHTSSASASPTDRDVLLLYTLERTCDAVADGELRDLGASVEGIRALLISLVAERIAAAPASRSVDPSARGAAPTRRVR